MDKNDFTDSLFRKVIAEIRKDIQLLESKSNKNTITQLNDRLNILEKIMAVSVMKNSDVNLTETITFDIDNENMVDLTEIPERQITLKELAENNGLNGKPSYISVDGIVYDASGSKLWDKGIHFGLPSGRELTTEYSACHSGRPRLERLPVVGRLVFKND